MKLEFTTTACVRPELLDETYTSLNKVLVDVDLKTEGILYINIDPVPTESESKINEELEVARDHFGEVHYNIGPSGGNFPTAYSWVLSKPTGEYFFNVEDDWLFETGEICIAEYINKIKHDTRDNILQCVAHPYKRGKRKIKNRAYLPPSLFQTSVLATILDKHPIPEDQDPEWWLIQLKRSMKLVNYNVVSCRGVKVIDMGTAWKEQMGLIKNEIYRGEFTKYREENHREKRSV